MINKDAAKKTIARRRKNLGLPDYIPANIVYYLSSYYAKIQIDVGSTDVVNGYGSETNIKIKIQRLIERNKGFETVFSWEQASGTKLEKAFEDKLEEISDDRFVKYWEEVRRSLT